MAGEKAIAAFLNKEAKREGNTVSKGDELYLFGNKIAEWFGNQLYITNAGWFSVTTKDRLNKLGANIYQKEGQWYFRDRLWDGHWIQIK